MAMFGKRERKKEKRCKGKEKKKREKKKMKNKFKYDIRSFDGLKTERQSMQKLKESR